MKRIHYAWVDIEENAEHHPVDDARVGSLSTCRNPADIVTEYDPEVDLVGTRDRAGR